jgi:hypothetical protein
VASPDGSAADDSSETTFVSLREEEFEMHSLLIGPVRRVQLLAGYGEGIAQPNAFDSDYQDVFGCRTQGRTVHAGLRLSFNP